MFLRIVFCLLLITNFVSGQLPPLDPAWQLVFSDDFSGTALDTSKWAQIPPWNQYGNKISGTACGLPDFDAAYKRWYLDTINWSPDTNNTKIRNGTLTLITKQENYTGKVWSWPNNTFTQSNMNYQYTTGMLYSKWKFRYGYFEIKFRLPSNPPAVGKSNNGLGPNFWLFEGQNLPASPTWSEIDIFEMRGSDYLFTTNVHFAKDTIPSNHISSGGDHGTISGSTWHTAAANWTANNIEFYLDGVKIREYPNHPDSLIPMPIFIDINSPSTNFCENYSSSTLFPFSYEIDYVKVYQKRMACDTAKTYCNVNGSTYVSKVYNSLEIGGSSCSADISNNATNSCLANNYVTLNEGFLINGTTDCYLNVVPCEIQSYYRFLRLFNSSTPAPPPWAWTERSN